MIASRLSLYLVLFFTLAVAIATPIAGPSGKRTNVSDIKAVLKTLKASTDSILPRINDLISKGAATDATATPLVNELTSALNSAVSSLDTLQPVETPEGSDEIATLMADIIDNIGVTFDNARATVISKAFADVGVAISLVLTVLGVGTPFLKIFGMPLGIVRGNLKPIGMLLKTALETTNLAG